MRCCLFLVCFLLVCFLRVFVLCDGGRDQSYLPPAVSWVAWQRVYDCTWLWYYHIYYCHVLLYIVELHMDNAFVRGVLPFSFALTLYLVSLLLGEVLAPPVVGPLFQLDVLLFWLCCSVAMRTACAVWCPSSSFILFYFIFEGGDEESIFLALLLLCIRTPSQLSLLRFYFYFYFFYFLWIHEIERYVSTGLQRCFAFPCLVRYVFPCGGSCPQGDMYYHISKVYFWHGLRRPSLFRLFRQDYYFQYFYIKVQL